jgi:hypothetical protein
MLDTKKMNQFYDAFWWLFEHPLFKYKGKLTRSCFPDSLNITTQKVNPETRRIEDDKSLNTHVEIWIEVTSYEEGSKDDFLYDEWRGIPCHDWELDCGGDTFEDAIVELARLVKEKYGDSNEPISSNQEG